MESRQQAEVAAMRYIAQRETGPWVGADAVALERWLAESVSHRVAYTRLHALWHEAGRLKAYAASGPVVSDSSAAAPSDTIRRPALKGLAIAASLVLAAVGGVLLVRDRAPDPDSYTTVVGGLQAVPMPDGSRVTLNTDSRLHIAVSEHERRVDLEKGEAFFEVARDSARPFVVHAGARRIVALGTQFSVRRDRDDVQVKVTEGAVRLEGGLDAQDSDVLMAGSVARSAANRLSVQRRPVPEIEHQLSWRSGILSFHDTPLADAVAEFNRYNSRHIVIQDAAIAAIEVGGVFGATKLDLFVSQLESGLPIRVIQETDRIVLTSR